jgi:hypothetical protein
MAKQRVKRVRVELHLTPACAAALDEIAEYEGTDRVSSASRLFIQRRNYVRRLKRQQHKYSEIFNALKVK